MHWNSIKKKLSDFHETTLKAIDNIRYCNQTLFKQFAKVQTRIIENNIDRPVDMNRT
jgi:hypothetical protein